jgi:hypothetical protein
MKALRQQDLLDESSKYYHQAACILLTMLKVMYTYLGMDK